MELIGWYVVTPLSIAALVTGLVTGLIQSFETSWGLFRYYWIVAKLILTIFAIAVLLRTLDHASQTLAMSALHVDHLLELRPHLIVHASAGLAVLTAITTLSIYNTIRAAEIATSWRDLIPRIRFSCYGFAMNKISKKPTRPTPKTSGFSFTLDEFEKISAVEGIKFSAELKKDFRSFDRKGLSNAERRRKIAEKYGAKSPKSD